MKRQSATKIDRVGNDVKQLVRFAADFPDASTVGMRVEHEVTCSKSVDRVYLPCDCSPVIKFPDGRSYPVQEEN